MNPQVMYKLMEACRCDEHEDCMYESMLDDPDNWGQYWRCSCECHLTNGDFDYYDDEEAS